MRLTTLFLVVGLVLGIGFAWAQTQTQAAGDTPKSAAQVQEVAQAANDTPGSVAEKPADTPETPEAAAEAAAAEATAGRTLSRMRMTTQAQRKAASRRAAERLRGKAGSPGGVRPLTALPYVPGTSFMPVCNAPTGQANADYMGLCPNYANSPFMRKFVDSLPGLGPANHSTLGLDNYIPIASADHTTYPFVAGQGGGPATPAADYYRIAVKEYSQKLHSDLTNPTKLRGYADLAGDGKAHYLGPLIIARRDTPVRIQFTNQLPKTTDTTGPKGQLFLPVDTTIMGAGMGPDGTHSYLQNRASLHLHGGNTPWISDGTPHQWTVPVGESTTYMKGVSNYDVPDMLPTNQDGIMTLYYPNQQSGRLMFYHDHSYGITRLNVYAGEAAGYLLTDAVEDDLINTGKIPGSLPLSATNVYGYGIPLIIQDKTFVSGTPNTAAAGQPTNATGTFLTDPTWPSVVPAGTQEGDLWFPHVYMPNQNPTGTDNTGANPMGRWDYGPWFWPPQTSLTAGGAVPCPTATNPNQQCPGTPNPSLIPEAFMDTPLVNGVAYPYVELPAQPTRFRILNATNDRHLNLQLYVAEPLTIAITNGGSGYTTAAPPTVNISGGGPGSVTSATAIVSTGSVTGVTMASGGVDYTSTVTVAFQGGGGTGAAGIASLSAIGSISGIQLTSGGSGYTSAPTVVIDDLNHPATSGFASASADITPAGSIAGVTVLGAAGYTSAPTVTFTGGSGTGAMALATANTEVKMVDAFPHTQTSTPTPACAAPEQSPEAMYLAGNRTALPQFCWPAKWPTDGRDGGVPDPLTAGPAMVQIGTEGGLLPAPVVIPSQPVGYNYNRRDIVVLNVQEKGLFMGPAERADVIVDFTGLAGKTLIVYNDSPAPVPASDPRQDYYTGNPDQTDTGGAPSTLPGYGPNTRTIMQIRLVAPAGTPAPFSLAALKTALPAAFATTFPANAASDHPMVPEKAYNPVYGTAANPTPFNDTYSRIESTNLTFTPIGATTAPATMDLQPKAIHELFDTDYGRMNSLLGVELPLTNWLTQTTIPLSYIDPPTEVINDKETQIWKITHNGVDTHAVHFHLFNVQLLNRVGWDGAIRPADANELGFKETVRMNPLEDAIVALRPMRQNLPFAIDDSKRLLDPTRPANTTGQFTNIDPATNSPVTVFNTMTNFGWEYVWHCHLLGHEENDMMRPVVFKVTPLASPVLSGTASKDPAPNQVVLNWTYPTGTTATGFRIMRTQGNTMVVIATITNNTTRTFTDSTVAYSNAYTYKIIAFSALEVSLPSNNVNVTTMPAPTTKLATPNAPTALLITTNALTLLWNNVPGATKYIVERAVQATNPVWTVVGQPTLPTLRVTGLTTKTTYLFRVSAANGNPSAQSNASNTLTVRTN